MNDSRLPPPNCHLNEKRLNREAAKAGKYTESKEFGFLGPWGIIIAANYQMREPTHPEFLRVFSHLGVLGAFAVYFFFFF